MHAGGRRATGKRRPQGIVSLTENERQLRDSLSLPDLSAAFAPAWKRSVRRYQPVAFALAGQKVVFDATDGRE